MGKTGLALWCSLIGLAFIMFSNAASGMVFNGKTTKVEPPLEVSEKLGGASGVTFSVWFKRNPAGLNRRNEIMNLTIATNNAKAVIGFFPDNTMRLGGRTQPKEPFRSASTASTWTDDKWHHAAGIIDLEKKETFIYVDGVVQELKIKPAEWNAATFPKQTGVRNTLGVGGDLRNYFHGELKNARVYNRALTESEINILFVIGENTTQNEIPSLIYHWKGDEVIPPEKTAPAAKTQATPAAMPESRLESPVMDEVKTVRFSGSPAEIGRLWGEIVKEETKKSVEAYIKEAEKRNISAERLVKFAAPAVDIVKEIAPHWLDEMKAMAETAGVDPDIYISYRFNAGLTGSPPRGIGWKIDEVEHECTSYAAAGRTTENNGIFYHKTRDNVPSVQRGYIMDQDTPGVYKYLLAGTMAVNEKGLALSGDYGGPRPAEPKYRPRIPITRYLMEKAADCEEALVILKEFVAKGWYTGGTIGQRWTIVDRYGRILDVTNSSDRDSLKFNYIEGKPHITRKSAQRLLETKQPISFLAFHDVSRDTLVRTSISGMSADIHPEYPEYLTIIWVSFPARSVPFPLFTGGRQTPLALFDGTINEVGKKTNLSFDNIRKLEKTLYEEGRLFREKLFGLIKEGKSEKMPDMIDEWVKNYTEEHLKALGAMK
ncbi:MAG TPA: carcinine hydrolase/isopenicillin-N N-acyltransferase family protein [bacterium]|nr:carcinine hydrolase/isopenicillin-N N-acyltransferase family protein [bacterium]